MKRTLIGTASVGLTSLLLTCAGNVLAPEARAAERQTRSSRENPLTLSLVQLIARPEDFDGEYIQVVGFYRHEFEGNAVYLHREDYEQGLRKNGLWLEGNAALDMSYILVEGRFNAKRHGHLNLYSGEIESVTRMMKWRR